MEIFDKSFFTNYIFNPFSNDLKPGEKAQSLIVSVLLALPLGLIHLGCYLTRDKKYSLLDSNDPQILKEHFTYYQAISDDKTVKDSIRKGYLYRVGRMYLEGKGTAQDINLAKDYLTDAARLSSNKAQSLLDQLGDSEIDPSASDESESIEERDIQKEEAKATVVGSSSDDTEQIEANPHSDVLSTAEQDFMTKLALLPSRDDYEKGVTELARDLESLDDKRRSIFREKYRQAICDLAFVHNKMPLSDFIETFDVYDYRSNDHICDSLRFDQQNWIVDYYVQQEKENALPLLSYAYLGIGRLFDYIRQKEGTAPWSEEKILQDAESYYKSYPDQHTPLHQHLMSEVFLHKLRQYGVSLDEEIKMDDVETQEAIKQADEETKALFARWYFVKDLGYFTTKLPLNFKDNTSKILKQNV